MKESKKKKIIIVILAFFLVLSVGYAIFQSSITINGTATAQGDFEIAFTNIVSITKSGYTDQSGNDGNNIAQISTDGKKLDILVDKLDYPGAYVEIIATITNKGAIPAKLKEIATSNLYQTGNPIKVSYDGLDENNTQFLVGESKNVTIKVKWDENINEVAEAVEFSIELKYEQINPDQITTTTSSQQVTKTYQVGEEITLGTESFYVMKDDGTTVKALAKYGLNVGDNLVSGATVGVQNAQVTGESLDGTVAFSSTMYWQDRDLSSSTFVYDSNSNLYQYVENYKDYLVNTLGKTSVSATLLSAEDAISLGCTWSDSIANSGGGSCPSSISWIYSMIYWTGSVSNYIFNSSAQIRNYYINNYDNGFANDIGFTDALPIRPVITISKSEI